MKNIKYLVLIVLTLVLFGCNYLNNAPTITGNQSVTYQIHSDEPNYLDLVTILDTEDDDILERVTIDSSDVDMDIIGTYTVEYSVIDSDGVGVTFSIEITITDSRDITLDLIGNDIVNILVGETYTEQGITAINADNEVIEYSIEGSVDTNTVGTYTLTYNLENYPQTITRTVNVVDTIPPVISLLIEDYYIQVGSDILIMPLVNIEDNYYTSIILFEIITEGEVDLDTIGVYDIAYYVIDPSLNQSNTVVRHVHVVDEIIPNITLNGSNEIYLEVGDEYTELGASVLLKDGYYEAQIDSDLDTNTIGDYTITYSYVVSEEVTLTTTRLIHVIDTTAPTISFEYYDYYVHVGDTFIDPIPTINDNYYDNNDLRISITGEVNTSVIGSYQITYEVTDPSENMSTEVSYTVYVVDEAVPSINLYGEASYDVEVEDLFVDAGAYVILEHERFEVDTTDTYDNTTLGTYTIDYTYIDGDYNLSVTRTINIVDTTAPVITLTGDSEYVLSIGTSFADPGATVTDNYDTELVITTDNNLSMGIAGTYYISYTATDNSGNETVVYRTIKIIKRVPDYTFSTFGNYDSVETYIELTDYDYASSGMTINLYDLDMNLLETTDELGSTYHYLYEDLYSEYTYTVEFIINYDLLDGNGPQQIIFSSQVTTSSKMIPTVTLDSYSYDNTMIELYITVLDWTDSLVGDYCVLNLYQEGLLINTVSLNTLGSSHITFEELEQDQNYTAQILCSYNLNTASSTDQQIEIIQGFYIPVLMGEGTEYSPYLIYSQQDLENISNDTFAYYSLSADLILDETFETIGDFSGTFDGNLHSITLSNLTNSDPLINRQGLFLINYGYIKNLYITNSTVTFSTSENGLLAAVNGGVIENVFILNTLVTIGTLPNNVHIGFIVGFNNGLMNNVAVKDSALISSNVFASEAIQIGGIVGTNGGMGIISNSYSNVEIDITNIVTTLYVFIGGISGLNFGLINVATQDSDIIVTNNNVELIDVYMGGIAGSNQSNIENVISAGNLIYTGLGSGDYGALGGFVGMNAGPITHGATYTNIEATALNGAMCSVGSATPTGTVLVFTVVGYDGQTLTINGTDQKPYYSTYGFIYETNANLSDYSYYLFMLLIQNGLFNYDGIDIASEIYPQVVTLMPYI